MNIFEVQDQNRAKFKVEESMWYLNLYTTRMSSQDTKQR